MNCMICRQLWMLKERVDDGLNEVWAEPATMAAVIVLRVSGLNH